MVKNIVNESKTAGTARIVVAEQDAVTLATRLALCVMYVVWATWAIARISLICQQRWRLIYIKGYSKSRRRVLRRSSVTGAVCGDVIVLSPSTKRGSESF